MPTLSLGREPLRAQIDPHGATLRHLWVRPAHGASFDAVATGPDMRYGGATIGRYANRIAGAQFQLDGRTYRLSANEGANTLHGGARGFDAYDWNVESAAADEAALTIVSPDGDQGFPGTMNVRVVFSVLETELRIAYEATCDADTIVNLTNHSYFNLSPDRARSVDHDLKIFADAYTPVREDLIPTGEIASVDGTKYDFRTLRPVAEPTYDMNWVLRSDAGPLREAVTLACADTACTLDILTTEPGLQVYSGNPKGIALEPQHFPDTPHHPHFPPTILRVGNVFRSTTIYRFNA